MNLKNLNNLYSFYTNHDDAQPAASAPPNCHPDRSSPAFSCARFVSAGPRSGGTVAAKSASTSHDVTG
jgi:hypothetical protein